MDIDYQIATYLQTAGYGTIGTSIFVDQIPDDVNGIWVTRSGGMLNKYIPIEESIVDIYIKNTDALECKTTLENIKRYLHRMHTTIINNAYVYTFLVLGDVEPVQRDLEYAKIYKITVQVVHRNQALIS